MPFWCQGEYEVDPIRDLRPVCPNCHLIIHSKKVPFTVEEVKNMLRKACKMD
jgi:5-methylcytosine-specific restriction protein A